MISEMAIGVWNLPQTGHGTHRLQDTETPVTKRARLNDYLHDSNDGKDNDQDSHDVDAATMGSTADNTSANNVEDAVDESDGYIDLDDPDFDNIMALEDDVERPWSELSSAVQDALRTFLGGKPDWFDKLMKGQGKFCLSRKNRAADHLFDGKYVACKSCAYTHDLCVSKFGTGNAARVVLRPLCAVDRAVYPNPPTFADVEYFRLPSTVNYAPLKNDKTQYANVH
ncbi:hypothetical protein EKO04_002137 [Ascochyta lentis]|uniref:Uncharacterized protein n=1 Tax=Ascochyta lentis TaxID=205686 RepID=A0A8H7J880_9PLEO|nr:hypothetical protein EKO04_002137 [Ascochyta lentis]